MLVGELLALGRTGSSNSLGVVVRTGRCAEWSGTLCCARAHYSLLVVPIHPLILKTQLSKSAIPSAHVQDVKENEIANDANCSLHHTAEVDLDWSGISAAIWGNT